MLHILYMYTYVYIHIQYFNETTIKKSTYDIYRYGNAVINLSY